jgi:hypothetical protein
MAQTSNRRTRSILLCVSLVTLAGCGEARIVAIDRAVGSFHHPGVLHSREDLTRMKENIALKLEPWASGYERLASDGHSSASWELLGPFARVARGADENLHREELEEDSNAAYQTALMWSMTGDAAFAAKSVEILNAWSQTLTEIVGTEAQIAAAYPANKLVNAAEILRYTYGEWRATDIDAFQSLMRDVFYPLIEVPGDAGWGGASIKASLGIGVFLNDGPIFERALDDFDNNACASLTRYIGSTGQPADSGRSQHAAQLGIGNLAEAAEVAWHQGVDLYRASDNRLLTGFEYVAAYNLGEPVPFASGGSCTSNYSTLSDSGRGELRPIYEMVWNHYENRAGIPAPFTKQAAATLRPEAAAFAADHPGFGTLTFSLPAP